MRVAIFGSTGTVGSELLAQALAAGHDVRALARTPSKLPAGHPRLTVLHGNVKDASPVSQTAAGADAVLSTLGATDKNDSDIRRVGTANILAAMREHGIRRLVVMGGFHLEFPGDPHNLGRKLIVPIIKLMGIVVEDTTAMSAAIQASNLDWTVVRTPRVIASRRSAPTRTGTLELGPWSKVNKGNVARFMLDCLTDEATLRQAPMICDRALPVAAIHRHRLSAETARQPT
ncbi:MAG: NAD(P)-dependent oxidoreductase [Trebonia sp.]